MKKLLLLLLPLLFISCVLSTGNKKSWDKDNIAYKNTVSDFTIDNYRSEDGTYVRTGFQRITGETGIIGKFTSVTLDSSNLYKTYQNTERYEFNEDGTYKWTHYIQSGNTVSENFKSEGKYKLYKYSDDYFIFHLYTRGNEACFYRVSNKGLEVIHTITDENGKTVIPENWIRDFIN